MIKHKNYLLIHLLYLNHVINTYEEHGEFRLGVVERDIRADEMGETFVDDLFDSLCASRSILR